MLDVKELVSLALDARKRAYCPYSNIAVGAAILTDDGKVYQGCNIESSSFSPTNCAERTALFSAIANGCRSFKAIAVAGGPKGEPPARYMSPCGVCRQALSEFCDDSLEVIMAKSKDDYIIKTLGELLPLKFGKDDVK